MRRWKQNGVPKARDSQVKLLDVAKRHEGYEEKSLREMMALAEQAGKLPSIKNSAKRRDGEKTTGYEVSRKGTGFLNEASLLKLRRHLETQPMQRGRTKWLATISVSAFVEEVEKGLYIGKMIQVDHPDHNQFVSDALISSGLQSSRQEMIESTIAALRLKMRETDARFYLHGSFMSTYDYKTEGEQREKRTSIQKVSRKRRKR